MVDHSVDDTPSVAGAPAPEVFDTLADSLTVARASAHGQADVGELWSSLLHATPADTVRALIQDLPAGSRVVVTFANEGAVGLAVKTPQMQKVLDGDLAPGGQVLFLRRLGSEGALARDPLSRLVLRNLLRFARRQGVTTLEVYPTPATLATLLAAGFALSPERWTEAVSPALKRRLALLRHLTRERGELAVLTEVETSVGTDPDGAATLAMLAAEARQIIRAHDLRALLLDPALPGDITIPPALQKDAGAHMPRFTMVLPLQTDGALDRVKRFLSGAS